jgi:hypothetical protein
MLMNVFWLNASLSFMVLTRLSTLFGSLLKRVLTDQSTFSRFERALGIPSTDIKGWQLQLARVSLSIFTLLSVATGLIYTAEHRVNPSINSYFDALYFGLTTLTTVGFGDVGSDRVLAFRISSERVLSMICILSRRSYQ